MNNDPTQQQVYWHPTYGVMIPFDAERWVAMTVIDGVAQIAHLDELPSGVNYRAIGWAADFACAPLSIPVTPS